MGIKLKTKGSLHEVEITGHLGTIIKHTRLGLGMSVSELSRISGVCRATINQTESGLNSKSMGWLRTNIRLLSALGYKITATF